VVGWGLVVEEGGKERWEKVEEVVVLEAVTTTTPPLGCEEEVA